MKKILVNQKYTLTETLREDFPEGTTATVLFIDDIGQVFVEWENGRIGSFPIKNFLEKFEQSGFDF